MHDFGIFIEMSPDEEQKAMLEQNIQMALSKQDISLEDAIDIREVRNLKVANQLLKVKRKQRQNRCSKAGNAEAADDCSNADAVSADGCSYSNEED